MEIPQGVGERGRMLVIDINVINHTPQWLKMMKSLRSVGIESYI